MGVLPEKTNPTTSRTGMFSIDSAIAVEAKITQLMRRLELLEVREPNLVNQVNPTPVINLGCTYCHALHHLFEECPIYQAQMYPENMNAAYTRPNYNPYSKMISHIYCIYIVTLPYFLANKSY